MKPENVLIGEDLHLRLIDFGDAKEFDQSIYETTTNYMEKKDNPGSDDDGAFELPDEEETM